KPEDGLISDANSKPDAEKDKEAAEDNSGGETDVKILDQKWKVLITGLPDSGWSECDIIHLVQSFGTPSDIILAIHMGKALVSFPDLELAEEIVKVHSFKPAMFKNIEVKMSLVKQQIGLNTPVALYNLFMGSLDPLESPALVGWSSLVVIRNVPDTPADSTEVLKLMRRFGTVIKSLVVNNMIICEMATTTMALSVYKRFLMFPCIIQNNPLLFYRKADPKAHTQTKIIPAYCDSSENKPADNSCAAAKHLKQDGVSHQDYREEKHADEKIETVKKTEAKNLTEKESKNDHVKEEELGVSVSSPAPDYKPDKDDAEIAEVNKDVSASELGNVVETKTPSPNAETAMPELPKMTQAMVNALLVECRTRTANSLNRTAVPPSGDQGQVKQEKEDQEKTADSTKDLAKNTMEEKDEAKKQDKERKEREAKKEERRERERERRERERRERDEKARKDIERREWERRERRRGYDERSSGSRSSYRQEGHRPSWRDDRYRGASVRGKDQLEEDHADEFPFNMSDFVTVDELGDVTDLPDLAVPMETSDKRDAAPQTEQQEVYKDTSGETTVTQEAESDEKVPESKHVSSQTPQTLNSLESGQDLNAAEPPTAASHIHMAPSETEGQPQPEASKDNINSEPDIMLASSPDAEPISSSPAVPAQSTSNSPAGAATAESDERKSRAVDHREAQNEGLLKVSNKQVEQPIQDEEKTNQALEPETSPAHSGAVGGLPVVLQTEKIKSSEDNTDTTGENVKKLLPPYDPSKAVGMEYLFPKTGFFCKVCSRFFTGAKVAEICHCKTLKHYENLQARGPVAESLSRDAEEAEAKAGSKLAQLITKSNGLRRPSKEKSAELKNIEEEILAKEEELRLM
ncbi:hypothetical protein AMECASPLE_026806, partial [Ameca splendens]